MWRRSNNALTYVRRRGAPSVEEETVVGADGCAGISDQEVFESTNVISELQMILCVGNACHCPRRFRTVNEFLETG